MVKRKKAKSTKHKANKTSTSSVTKKRKCYSASQAQGALDDIHGGMSVKSAAKKWHVPRTTLQDLKKGLYVVSSRPGPSPVLSGDEEALLCEWVIEMARRGIPLNKNCLLDSVQKILFEDPRDNPFSNSRPGAAWFSAFLSRHPEISQRNAESISRARGALTEGCIRGWFDDLQKFMEEKGIEYILGDPKRQYNGDETGFQLDPHGGKVLAPKGEIAYTESGGMREQITVLVTSRADGVLMTSAIVYPYKRAVPKNIADQLPQGFCAGRSESGWMNSEVFFEYMANTFIPELASIRKQEKGLSEDQQLVLDKNDWVVYWIDGYSSHLTLHTSKLCELNKIVLYCFKAHASHICQPNDLGPFKPLKSEWKLAMSEWRHNHPYEVLTRCNFAPVLAKAVAKLSSEAVASGYRAAGLYPFNPNAVHYERLTSTNQSKFDIRAFGSTEKSTDVEIAENEHQTTLRCIETALGSDIIGVYDKMFSGEMSLSQHELPDINAFFIWQHFKIASGQLVASSGPALAEEVNSSMLTNIPAIVELSTDDLKNLQDADCNLTAIPLSDLINQLISSTSMTQQEGRWPCLFLNV